MNTFRAVIALLVVALVLGLGPVLATAQSDVGINPPADPTPVGGAVLSFHRRLSVPRLTIPGQFQITDSVENVGTLPAVNTVLTQDLPAGWTVNGQSVLSVTLGTIAPGQTLSQTSTFNVASSSMTGRFANEAIVSADGLDSVQAQAPVDLTHPSVLGAETLAETGDSPVAWLFVGLSCIALGLGWRNKLSRN